MNTELIQGGMHTDARGSLRFCNDFDMSAVKRFYTISNSSEQPVRGWIGHKRETKWFFPLKGTTEIVVEPMDDGRVERAERVKGMGVDVDASTCFTRSTRFILSETNPSVLCVSPGNWFCIEQHDGAEVMVFSDCQVGEYENDDFRKQVRKLTV